MSVRCNGSTGYLTLGAGVVTSLPFYIAFYVAERSDTGTFQTWVAHSQASADKYAWAARHTNGNVFASYAWTGNGDTATKVGPTLNTTLRVCVAAFQSTGRQMWYGDTTEGTSSVSGTDQVSSHDTFTIGALLQNGAGAAYFGNIDICEVHIYTGTPTDTEYSAFAAATSSGNYPEDLTGWVDGWVLSDSSDLTSIGGTRALSIVGGVTDGVANPFTHTLSGGSSSGALKRKLLLGVG